jgi:hypothetical protein
LAAALLSTGDTFLIAACQSLCMDVRFPAFFDDRRARPDAPPPSISAELGSEFIFEDETYRGISSSTILAWSRRAMLAMVAIGVLVIAALSEVGFQVADLVFVIYGSTVCLFPSIVVALVAPESTARRLGNSAVVSVIAGLAAGWLYGTSAVIGSGATLMGRFIARVVPLPGGLSPYSSPTVALVVATATFGIGFLYSHRRRSR